MHDIIRIDHLSKRFGEVQAVQDLSFRVKEGELTAHNVNGSGLACAVDAQERKQLSLLHAEAQILHRFYCSKAFAQVIYFDLIIHFCPQFLSSISFFPISILISCRSGSVLE